VTVQLIRQTAKELAGAFYEMPERTPLFRKVFPTVKDFLTGRIHRSDGTVKLADPNWWQFLDLAKQTLVNMLNDKGIHEHLKQPIYEALIEEARRGSKPGAKRVTQTNLEKREDQKHAYSEMVRG
jgi:hypothetical protein